MTTVMPLDVAIRRRPGMYLGDTGRIGCLRVISTSIDMAKRIIKGSVLSPDKPAFEYHAFLDVMLENNRVHVTINFDDEEFALVHADREKLLSFIEDPSLVPTEELELAIFFALADDLQISASLNGKAVEPFQQDHEASEKLAADTALRMFKDSYVSVSFGLCDVMNWGEVTTDFLQGYLIAAQHVGGLVDRTIEVA